MSRFFEILLNIFWFILAVGGCGWLFWRALKKSEDPEKVVFKIILSILLVGGEILFLRHLIGHLQVGAFESNAPSAFVIAGSVAMCGIALSIMWTPQISGFLFSPLTNLFDGGSEPPDPKPLYSAAIAKRNRGNFLEAVVAVREQLAKFPNDFEGVMLLARIQAEDMKDLASAEITLNKFCADEKSPAKQVAAAWTQLADWHLKIGVDVDSARESLEKIVARFPQTELALQAEQRLAHLGGTQKILLGAHDRHATAVPAGVKNLGLRDSTDFIVPAEIAPEKLAAAHVKHLETHPHDSEVREKLAMIYANDFQRLDLATLELEQLINEKRHSTKQIAGWLNLLANFQIKLGADVATVRVTLEKIVEQFPDLPVADIARRRLARIESEFRGKKETPGVKLGVYEQNIGLKYGSPRKL